MAVGAVDFDFVEHREGHRVFGGAELFDFRVRAGFLSAKLIARETAHDQPLRLILLVSGFERRVLRREPAVRRDVDDEQHLARIRLERRVLAVNVLERYVVNGFRGIGGNDLKNQDHGQKDEYFHDGNNAPTGADCQYALFKPSWNLLVLRKRLKQNAK